MNLEQKMAEFKSKIERYARELAEQLNLITLGGQIKIDATIVPAPDVWVRVDVEGGWFIAQTVELTDDDWRMIQRLEFPHDLQFLQDRLVAAGNEGIFTRGSKSQSTRLMTKKFEQLNGWFNFEKKLPFCVVKSADGNRTSFRLLRERRQQ